MRTYLVFSIRNLLFTSLILFANFSFAQSSFSQMQLQKILNVLETSSQSLVLNSIGTRDFFSSTISEQLPIIDAVCSKAKVKVEDIFDRNYKTTVVRCLNGSNILQIIFTTKINSDDLMDLQILTYNSKSSQELNSSASVSTSVKFLTLANGLLETSSVPVHSDLVKLEISKNLTASVYTLYSTFNVNLSSEQSFFSTLVNKAMSTVLEKYADDLKNRRDTFNFTKADFINSFTKLDSISFSISWSFDHNSFYLD